MSIPTFANVLEIYRGTWVADVTSDEAPTGAFELGIRTWSGTVIPTGYIQDGSKFYARIVGGKGQLGKQLLEKEYRDGVLLSRIASDIIRDAGEVAGTINAATSVSYYERARGTAGQALNVLCDAAGLNWWVDRDGKTNVAPARTTANAIDSTKAQQIGADVDGSVTLNVTTADDVQPGMLAGVKTTRAIWWRLTSGSLVAECSPIQPTLPDSRGDEFYLKQYDAKVDSQNGDGSVNVIANSGAFALNNVPMWPGVVGQIKLNPGERVIVGFLGGNRSQPYAVPGQLGDGTSQPAALKGDSVTILLPPFAFVGTVGGAPATGVMTALTGQTLGTITGPCSQRTKLQ